MSSHSTIRRSLEDRIVLCVDCDDSRTLSLSASGNLVCSICGSDNWMHLPMNANIKETIFIKGDLVVQEDLTVEGCVEGRVEMNHHNLCIGAHGTAQAEIHAKNVIIAGHVTGSIFASELVEIKQSGSVQGNIQCSRMSIVDGAKFTGRLNTEKMTDDALGLSSPKTQAVKIGGGTS